MELPPNVLFFLCNSKFVSEGVRSPIERNASMTGITRQVPRTSDLKLWIQNGKCCVRITKNQYVDEMQQKCNDSEKM